MKALFAVDDRGRSTDISSSGASPVKEYILYLVGSCRYRNTYILFWRSAPTIRSMKIRSHLASNREID